MAGGMGRRGDRVSLHERIHGTPTPEQFAAPVVKHCWVTDRHVRLPGLLLEWRRTASGWQGRVVRPALEAGEWIVVERNGCQRSCSNLGELSRGRYVPCNGGNR